jgi:hypothetical protein
MHEAQHAKQTETDRVQKTLAQKPSSTKQRVQRVTDPTRMPLYTQTWGNQPPPWLRWPVQLKEPREGVSLQGESQPAQRKENHTGLPDTLKAGVG